jgi:hypothetical protein
MEFGVFAEQMRRGSSQGESFREMFDLVDAGESWGLDVFWLAEMLVNPTPGDSCRRRRRCGA